MSPPSSNYRNSNPTPLNRPSRSSTYSQMPSSRSMSIPTPASDIGRSPSKQSVMGVGRPRASSVAHGFTGLSNSPGSFPPRHSSQAGLTGITLPPLNNSVSQLATLSHSAQTLSPYARAHEHVAVRSFPHGLHQPGMAGPSSGSGTRTSSGSGVGVGVGLGKRAVGLGVVMGSDLSGPTYGNAQSSGSIGTGGDGRVGRVLGRAGAMVYASQMQRERYEESKAAYADGAQAVKGTRKRFYDFSKKRDAGQAQIPSRNVSPDEIGEELGMSSLSLKADGAAGAVLNAPRTPGVELMRPKVKERVSYGFPRVP